MGSLLERRGNLDLSDSRKPPCESSGGIFRTSSACIYRRNPSDPEALPGSRDPDFGP
jgi:hypothetical protein